MRDLPTVIAFPQSPLTHYNLPNIKLYVDNSSPVDSESEPSSGMVLWTTNQAATILSCMALSFASAAGILYPVLSMNSFSSLIVSFAP